MSLCLSPDVVLRRASTRLSWICAKLHLETKLFADHLYQWEAPTDLFPEPPVSVPAKHEGEDHRT